MFENNSWKIHGIEENIYTNWMLSNDGSGSKKFLEKNVEKIQRT